MMANYGRGWGNDTPEEQDKYNDEIAKQEGDWSWLEKSPRQERLRREQGITDGSFAEDDT